MYFFEEKQKFLHSKFEIQKYKEKQNCRAQSIFIDGA